MIGLAAFAVLFSTTLRFTPTWCSPTQMKDSVAINVGFYYMANAGGRLLGTLLSGYLPGRGIHRMPLGVCNHDPASCDHFARVAAWKSCPA